MKTECAEEIRHSVKVLLSRNNGWSRSHRCFCCRRFSGSRCCFFGGRFVGYVGDGDRCGDWRNTTIHPYLYVRSPRRVRWSYSGRPHWLRGRLGMDRACRHAIGLPARGGDRCAFRWNRRIARGFFAWCDGPGAAAVRCVQ